MLNNYFEYFPIVSSVFSSVRVKCSLMYIYSHLSCFCFSGDGDHFQGWHCHFATQLRRSVETGHGRNAKGKLHLSITFIGSVDLRTKEALKQMVLFAERCRLIFQAWCLDVRKITVVQGCFYFWRRITQGPKWAEDESLGVNRKFPFLKLEKKLRDF